ncbi:thioredoxin-like protein [Polychytrium aggregatum]|uniref:thioredoxin-like protein n=1 Tax=Polychytrium aggregatum TaxID=110093 RepID=UPI0022FF3E88|nr:thioredoxin-like protein [Polychytrium aggregatum]KAI9209335.1 thioredoxin-like protein [Polychytrium aggregatum]
MQIKSLLLATLSLVALVRADAATQAAADQADQQIRFLSHDQVASATHNGTWLLLFGPKWCGYTQRFTPKWLQVQNTVDQEHLNVNLAKIDCTTDADFCTGAPYHVTGYPTVILVRNGQVAQEYPGADEVQPLLDYIHQL